MGSFRICSNCERGHPKPTPYQDLFSPIVCKCGKPLDQYMSEREWIVDLSDKIERLEKILGIIHN